MTFVPEKVDDFLKVFNDSKELIRSFNGCRSVTLFRGINEHNICFTYSIWDSEVHLEKYRRSEVFKSTWERTKVLFSDKPEAWSIENTGL